MSNVKNNDLKKKILRAIDAATWRFKQLDDAAVRKSQQAYDAAANSEQITLAVACCDAERLAAREDFKARLNSAFEPET